MHHQALTIQISHPLNAALNLIAHAPSLRLRKRDPMLERVLKDPILKSRRSDSGHTSALAFLRQVRGPEPGGVVVGGWG